MRIYFVGFNYIYFESRLDGSSKNDGRKLVQKYFSSQQEDEDVVMIIRKHWFVLVPSFAMGIFVYLFGILLVTVFPLFIPSLVSGLAYNIYVLVVSLLFLFNTAYLFSVWLIHYLNVGIITTEHVVEICQESLFSRKISQLGLDKIQDVTASQKGITQTMFNYGDVDIQTAGELPNFNFTHIPTPNEIAQRIMEIEEDYSNKHGIRRDLTPNPKPEEQPPTIEYPINTEDIPTN